MKLLFFYFLNEFTKGDSVFCYSVSDHCFWPGITIPKDALVLSDRSFDEKLTGLTCS